MIATTTRQQSSAEHPEAAAGDRRRAASTTSSPVPVDAQAATGTKTASTTAPKTALRRPHHLPNEDMCPSSPKGATSARRSTPNHGDRIVRKLPGRRATCSQRPGKDDDLYMNLMR